MTAILRLQNVTALFGQGIGAVRALDGITMDVAAGDFVTVMGATGSGKSTLLNCAAGLERVHSGRVELLGEDITRLGERALSALRRRHVGVVFQSYNLLSELTVAQNVLLPCRLGARAARTVGEVLAAVGLAGFERRGVGSLSGGERQRVAIARTLITAPAVIFADEPTGALDPDTGGQVIALLRRAVDSSAATVVMVSHDPAAAAAGDRIVILRAGRTVIDRATPDAAAIRVLLSRVAAYDDVCGVAR